MKDALVAPGRVLFRHSLFGFLSSLGISSFVISRQHFVGGAQAVVEGFLEQRDAAEVGVGEMDVAIWPSGFATLSAGDETGARPNHRVPPTKNVQSSDQLANLRMRALEIGEHDVGQVRPFRVE
jgi:hypothetical protein